MLAGDTISWDSPSAEITEYSVLVFFTTGIALGLLGYPFLMTSYWICCITLIWDEEEELDFESENMEFEDPNVEIDTTWEIADEFFEMSLAEWSGLEVMPSNMEDLLDNVTDTPRFNQMYILVIFSCVVGIIMN